MRLTIHSTLSSEPGHMVIDVEPDDTVHSLIAAFCNEKGIAQRRHYVIRDINQTVLPIHSKLSGLHLEDDDTVYIGMREDGTNCFCGCNQWWLLAGVALFIGLMGITAITVSRIRGNKQPMEYGIVIDAGSSHSELFVYKWRGNKNNGTAVAREITSCYSSGGGISQYTNDPSQAGKSLEPCLDVAHNAIPAGLRRETPIYLGATAGMRLLEQSDNETCQAILNSVRETIMNTEFLFATPDEDARIISGEEEGTFSWVTTNYLTDAFGEFQESTSSLSSSNEVGALDLGGASTQMTFVPEHPEHLHLNQSYMISLYGHPYTVYTHSCLCYGQDEAQRQLHANLVKQSNYSSTVTDPCLPLHFNMSRSYTDVFEAPCTLGSGEAHYIDQNFTILGSSDSDLCHIKVSEIFNLSISVATPPCVLQQPPLFGNYMAFSGFYYTTTFLNISDVDSATEFSSSIQNYCSKPWQEIEEIPVDKRWEDMRWLSCFRGNFIDILLTDEYGFNDENWHTLQFVNKIDDTSVGWTLGFMLVASNSVPASYPHQHISLTLFILMLLLFIVFIVIALLFSIHALRVRQRKYSSHHRLSDYGSL